MQKDLSGGEKIQDLKESPGTKNMNRVSINSEDDLKAHSVTILRRINKSERGGLLFLINPVFALKDAGFDLNPAMRRHIRTGLRYGSKTKAQIRELEAEIAELAGHKVNVTSNAEVNRLLFKELKLPAPTLKQPIKKIPAKLLIYEPEEEIDEESKKIEKVDYSEMPITELRVVLQKRGMTVSGNKSDLIKRLETDDTGKSGLSLSLEALELLSDKHPVVPKIVKVRKLRQTGWRFVNKETYNKVKSGDSVTLLRRVRFRQSKFRKSPSEGGKICR